LACCADILSFLKKNDKNVAAVHCKAGKGRTGLMLSAYLLYAGTCKTAAEALEMFGRERTSNNKGVTIPSQMRYVRYMEFYLKTYHSSVTKEFPLKGVPLKITSFRLNPIADFDVGGGCDPYFILSNSEGKKFYNHKKNVKKIAEWRKEGEHEIKCDVAIQGDVIISFYDHDAVSSDDKMFACWINTSFVRKPTLLLKKNELDKAVKDKGNKHFPSNFTLEITFSGVPEYEDDDDIPPPPPPDEKADSETDEDEKDDIPPPPDYLDGIPPPPPSEDVPPPPPPEEKEKKEEKKEEKKDSGINKDDKKK
jgi:phosphatidylinositol-3,4,5-trisphosphate 3-phosphatase/dual-specificity protein phosphatase PTEN